MRKVFVSLSMINTYKYIIAFTLDVCPKNIIFEEVICSQVATVMNTSVVQGKSNVIKSKLINGIN